MTGVYRSYIDFSDLLPSLIYSFVLLAFPLGSVFCILGVMARDRRLRGLALSAALDVTSHSVW